MKVSEEKHLVFRIGEKNFDFNLTKLKGLLGEKRSTNYKDEQVWEGKSLTDCVCEKIRRFLGD